MTPVELAMLLACATTGAVCSERGDKIQGAIVGVSSFAMAYSGVHIVMGWLA